MSTGYYGLHRDGKSFDLHLEANEIRLVSDLRKQDTGLLIKKAVNCLKGVDREKLIIIINPFQR